MTHQSSLSTRTNSCIPTRVACITDSRCHHPRHDGLELNIQLPDFDLNIPPCPACPPCPPCPQLKPDTGLEPDTGKPKTKEPIDISQLTIRVPVGGDDILDARTEKPTGLKAGECKKLIENPKNDLEIVNGKIVGKCYDNSRCDECVEALNSSIIDNQYAEPFMSTLEGTVYII